MKVKAGSRSSSSSTPTAFILVTMIVVVSRVAALRTTTAAAAFVPTATKTTTTTTAFVSRGLSSSLVHHAAYHWAGSRSDKSIIATIHQGRQSARPPFPQTTTRRYASSSRQQQLQDEIVGNNVELSMENLYKEWTLEEDEKLWKHRNKSIDQLASIMGRGLRGVRARLQKLKDVNSAAYQRMFVEQGVGGNAQSAENDDKENSKTKLIPAGEVLRRIQWDHQLDENDFFILHYDRMDDKIIESPYTAPNSGISGSSTRLVDALPEHRVMGIKYKERIVWDREERVDLVFGSPGIASIINGYNEWQRRQQEAKETNKRRQAEVALRLQKALGPECFNGLKSLSSSLVEASKESSLVAKKDVEDYVVKAQEIFRNARSDPTQSTDQSLIPMSDYQALDMLSELVALWPEKSTREVVLTEISTEMMIAEGKKVTVANRELPQLNEDDLTESFVRGSGPGGQKVNKTSNRVLLVHNPTQLQAQVQDTRSLEQNRKIARRRLREKLDEHLNGKQSRSSVAADKASSKKAKAKARAKARQRRKQEAKEHGTTDSELN